MTKKFGFLLVVFCLALGGFSFYSNGKVEAASSGYITQGGITAEVYTDRTGSYPASDDWIGATGVKTATGGTVYYEMEIIHVAANGSEFVCDGPQTGYFSSQSPQKIFYIDNFLAKGDSGLFKVLMKLYSDPGLNNWIGDWYTPQFAVYN